MAASILAGPEAAAQIGAGHQHDAEVKELGIDGQVLCPICPATRESSGTSWQPDTSSGHRHGTPVGAWQLRTHGQIVVVETKERGPRGDSDLFGLNHAMIDGRRTAWGGVVGVRSMWSLEPLMGRRGYPLLTQTGETADGVTPLIDRQHPHDFPMELAATYSQAIGPDRAFYLYVAPVGAPALGPPAVMHRLSAASLPIAPITHHWFDSTHITFGVVTAGFVSSPAVKFEASVFNGREPDQDRWGFEAPRLDSFAFRVSINPRPSLAVQLSAGFLNAPEQLHQGADIGRLTVSAIYTRQWRLVVVDATLALGRNSRTTSVIPVTGGAFVFPGVVSGAALAEATVHVASRHALIGRIEHAQKDELFPIADPRHNILFPVTRATAGYSVDVARLGTFTLTLGAAASWTSVDQDIRTEYGGPPGSVLIFAGVRTH